MKRKLETIAAEDFQTISSQKSKTNACSQSGLQLPPIPTAAAASPQLTTPATVKDPTTPHLVPTSPLLNKAHTMDVDKEEVPFAVDTTADTDKEEDVSDLVSRLLSYKNPPTNQKQ
jgi:hypothetical protein